MSQRTGRTGVLAHNQPAELRASTHVPREVADELVRRLICERISHKLIRMLPPKSVFLAERPNRPASYSLPDRIPSPELPGVRFKPPASSPEPRIAYQNWNWTTEPWPSELLRLSPDPRSPFSAAAPPTHSNACDSGELPL